MAMSDELNFLREQVLGNKDERKEEIKKEEKKEGKETLKIKKSPVQGKKQGKREAYILYYNLKDKGSVKKVQFSYALTGRPNKIGLLQKLKGKKLGKGCLLVPSVKIDEMENFFNQWKVDTMKQKMLILDERPM